ncbi:MAG: substrate-binding domain-containing protein [Deltaproteobacteria bacterium]|nr:substrate-binding domain-containing protein [Deltaproteobacteria bacterium]
MKKVWLLLSCLLACLTTTAIPGGAEVKIVIRGTGDSQNLLRSLATGYQKSQPAVSIEVPDSIGSSGGGIKATAAGKCQLGRVSRPLSKKEKALNLSYLFFARSPVVFLANTSVSAVKGITDEQAAAIFSGAITHWSAVGGPHERIYVDNREKGDSSLTVIETHIPAFKVMKKQAGQTLYSTQENITTIGGHRQTIGYANQAEAAHQPGLLVLRLNGVSPGRKNVDKGAYKLVSLLGLAWKDGPGPAAQGFLNFLHSSQAEEIIMEHGAFPALGKE